MYWRKSIIYVFTVLLPALMVGISNFHVFPDASLLATLMLVVTSGVAGVFTYFSGDATARVRRYCILADVVICAILCVNLGGHWILAREVSAARQGVEERHSEEEREERRREAEAERQLRLKEAEAALVRDQAKVIREERRRLAQLPPGERRSVLKAPPKVSTSATPTAFATIQPLSLAPVETPKTIAPRMTPDDVREKWWWFLTALAIAECAASVLAGVVLSGVWEWDRNHDGIPDHLQNSSGVAWPRQISATNPENLERSGAGKAQKAAKVARNFDEPLSGQGSKAPFETFDTPSPKTFSNIQSASDCDESLNQFGENVETRASASVDGETCPICGGALAEQSGKRFKHVWCPTPGHLDAWRDAGK
ncbi:MAG TPA: hypothetical protein VFV58_11180 [Blastocatellia bacterium]|jgi:hypothetical protein|nr:hypothetical protein [Blastocatellia bacterium]